MHLRAGLVAGTPNECSGATGAQIPPPRYWHLTEAELRQAVGDQAGLDGGKTGHHDPPISFYNAIPRPLAQEALRRGDRGVLNDLAYAPAD